MSAEAGRLTTLRDGRYAAQLVEEVRGARWYVWDLRGTDPWWLPEGKRDDEPGLDAQTVLREWLAIEQDQARGRERAERA